MAKNTKKLVLTPGSEVEILHGEHSRKHARVVEVLGSPYQKRSVRASLLNSDIEIELEQHNLKVVANPYGWQASSRPVYTPVEQPSRYQAKAYNPEEKSGPKIIYMPPQKKKPDNPNRKSRRKR